MAWMSVLYTHPPVVVDSGHGGGFADVDGNAYLDFNLADTSMFTGYGVEAITRAVSERTAPGSQFLLPTEDAVEVAGRLADRFGMPFWQFTLSATLANTEALRVARAVTGRDGVLMFDGKYHGHADELLATLDDGAVAPDGRGVLSVLGIPVKWIRWMFLLFYRVLGHMRGGGGPESGSRWSARSVARTNDLDADEDPPHTLGWPDVAKRVVVQVISDSSRVAVWRGRHRCACRRPALSGSTDHGPAT